MGADRAVMQLDKMLATPAQGSASHLGLSETDSHNNSHPQRY
jgi:hypothetical protein